MDFRYQPTRRRCAFPVLVMLPRRVRSPLECSLATAPLLDLDAYYAKMKTFLVTQAKLTALFEKCPHGRLFLFCELKRRVREEIALEIFRVRVLQLVAPRVVQPPEGKCGRCQVLLRVRPSPAFLSEAPFGRDARPGRRARDASAYTAALTRRSPRRLSSHCSSATVWITSTMAEP